MLLSICIPAYNRPETLLRLLKSIDIECANDIEVIICEDFSPKREAISNVVHLFSLDSPLKIRYFENPVNYGFDKNLRELVYRSEGDYVMYMGDDDYFVYSNLKPFLTFLNNNPELGYVLKTWVFLHENGWQEPFNYFDGRRFFEASPLTFVTLFRISTFVSGFTFKRTYGLPFLTDIFDGTLLFQLYILGELTLKYPSAFCEIPLTIQTKEKADVPHFGSSASEKDLFTPGRITIANSINFLKGYFQITKYLDNKYNIETTHLVKRDMTKYSYSYLYLHRDKGLKEFTRLYRLLTNEVELNETFHIHAYYYALFLLGKKNCDRVIHLAKKILRKTPAS
jgi:glycosyltransferase involved in cell wall biosynthesis